MTTRINRRSFLGASAAAGLGAFSLTKSAAGKATSAVEQTSQIAHTDGQRLDTVLYALAQSALPVDHLATSKVTPTITITDSSIISNTQYHTPIEARVFAGTVKQNQGYITDWNTGGPNSYVSGLYETPNVSYEWMTDGSQCELTTVGRGGIGRILVDGVPVYGAYSQPADGGVYRLTLDFGGSRAVRRITLQTSYGFGLYYIVVSADDTFWQSPRQIGPRCIVMGDSFTEGTGAYFPCDGYPAIFGKTIGWEDTWASGSGGTGYLATGPQGRYNFRQRVQSDIIAHTPNIVIIAGGTNDGNSTAAQVQAEAILLYRQIRAGLPNVRLYALSPWRPRPGVSYPPYYNVFNGIQAAAAAVPGTTFVDVSNYFSGSGYNGNPTGTGNCDYYISADGEHPSPAGHVYLGQRLASDIAALQQF